MKMRYDYKCAKCEKVTEFELPMSFDKKETLECPKCKNKGLERVYSAINISGGKSEKAPSCTTGTCPFV